MKRINNVEQLLKCSHHSVNRYQEKKQKGEMPKFRIQTLPPSRREKLREIWRNSQTKYRAKRRNFNALLNMTPPDNSIYDGDIQVDPGQVPGPTSPPPSPPTSPPPSPHTEKIKKLNKSLRRLKDQNKRLQRKVSKEKKRAEKYRKQSVRQNVTKLTVREKSNLPARKK